MIKLLKSTEINREKWDNCIKNSQSPLIYAQSWYLDGIAENWMALVENDYESVFPICYKKKLFITKINQPIFAQQLGIFSQSNITQTQFDTFLKLIPKTFVTSYINFNYSNNSFLNNLNVKKRANYVLNLKPKQEEIFSSFSDNLKRNIKKAIRNELKIEVNRNSILDVMQYYEQNLAIIVKGIPKKNWKNFQNICQKAKQLNQCFTLSAFKNNETLCMAIFFVFEKRLTYILGSANNTGKNLGANHFLLDFVINKYANSNFSLDFEGSNIDSLARFYESFGAKNEYYCRLSFDFRTNL